MHLNTVVKNAMLGLFHFYLVQQRYEPFEALLVTINPDKVNLNNEIKTGIVSRSVTVCD